MLQNGTVFFRRTLYDKVFELLLCDTGPDSEKQYEADYTAVKERENVMIEVRVNYEQFLKKEADRTRINGSLSDAKNKLTLPKLELNSLVVKLVNEVEGKE